MGELTKEREETLVYNATTALANTMNYVKFFEAGYSNPRCGKIIMNHEGRNFLVTIEKLTTEDKDETIEEGMKKFNYLFK